MKLLLIFAFLIPGVVNASEIINLPFSKVASKARRCCVIKVENIEINENYQVFTGGVKKRISETIIITGLVVESLKGTVTLGPINTSYTMHMPVMYDEHGKETGHFSPILECSGLEFSVKKGASYIFSFYGQTEKGEGQKHFRMDLLKDKAKLKLLLQSD